jgi:hypothetical protein
MGTIEEDVTNPYIIKYLAAVTDEDAQKILDANSADMKVVQLSLKYIINFKEYFKRLDKLLIFI